jgi:hypothetical protein
VSRDTRSDPRQDHARDRSDARQPDRIRVPERERDEDRGQERTERRHDVTLRDRTYRLRESELEMLTTIGTFRVVLESDLERDAPSRTAFPGDVQSLERQGLLERAAMSDGDHALALTRDGKEMLESRRDLALDSSRQAFHAGLKKPRELAHDAQLYRVYRVEAERIGRDGGRVRRVVLDYEIKREYQRFINRVEERARDRERRTFADQQHLHIVQGSLEIPDLRIEYEHRDGHVEYRDVELVTEHYSRSQLAGKRAAGFAMYRAGSSHTGGTPYDPHYLEEVV